MPATDKQPKSSTSKPITPALSSNFRNVVKSPLTPRVAGSPSQSPIISSTKQPFVRSRSPAKPDQTTTPLGGNITPRSAARKSRVGTESPLTPAQSKVLPTGPRSRASSGTELQKSVAIQAQGLGITSPRLVASTSALARGGSPSPTPVVTVHRRASAAKSAVEGSKDTSSKFFHASEAKSAIGSLGVEESPRFPPKPGHFFVGSPPLSATGDSGNGKSDPDDKFFRANDIPQNALAKRTVLPHIPIDRLNNAVSTTARQEYRNTPPQSPKKTYNPSIPEPSSPQRFQSSHTPSPPAQRTAVERARSISNGIIQGLGGIPGHRKSLSADSKTSQPTRNLSGPRAPAPQPLDLRRVSSASPRVVASSLLAQDPISPRSISLASTHTVPASITSDIDLSEIGISLTILSTASDQRSEQPATPIQPQSDEASNARRERKVLDLEISNSSLLAINKTLERELRKQSTELRRFRRLSRSGRLSIAPSSRAVSEQSNFSLDTLTELDEDQNLSDFDDSDDYLDDEDSSILSASSSSVTSPSARSRQRTRDEKRLMQDLSRHQQLLLDSQKLNQSMKRCLTVTEDLIREGNKALDYRVGIGDVKLGGRVLSDEELDERGLVGDTEEVEARQGLLSPSIKKTNLAQAQHWNTDLLPVQLSKETEPSKESTAISSLDELTEMLDSFSAESGQK
ncbi:hypothetical protein H2200_013166 [Cladophialophora chaetospira]|uniref:Uncharacterized protein n=1 Tax=Cladophialophora chaetospira TaxID=386627 RepID=A0AA38WW99_9EURO|nr:hypothetical protein H2200_013166 [Cladophialophora chaetospira]